MRTQKRREREKQLVVDALTYYRLQADVAAVEREVSSYQLLAMEDSKNVFQKMWKDVQNEYRKKTLRELQTDEEQAKKELSRFTSEHKNSCVQLAANPEKLKTIINKTVFKGDRYGLGKLQFALTLYMGGGYSYRRPEQSLQAVSALLFDDANYIKNASANWREDYVAIGNTTVTEYDKGFLAGMGLISLLSFSLYPVVGAGLSVFIRNKMEGKKLEKSFRALSGDEAQMAFALKLTLAREAKKALPEADWKRLTDEFLRQISDFRADAEYSWAIERIESEENKCKIGLCNRCIERLAQI